MSIKKRLFLPFLGLGLLFTNSCSEEFLDKKPLDQLTDASFWNNADDAQAGLNAVYNDLQWGAASDSYWQLANIPSGDLKPTENDNQFNLEKLNFLPINSKIQDFWTVNFKGVAHANTALANIPAILMDEAVKKPIIGQLKFLRGFYYFQLARAFGDVPLILEEQTANSPINRERTPVAQVFEQIAKDFTEAAADLPVGYDDTDKGRATRGAALAYLAYTQLYQKKWPEVKSNSEAVLALPYSLVPDYAKVFAVDNENNAESIFEVQYRDDQDGGWGPGRDGHYDQQNSAPRGIGNEYAPYGGWGNFVPTKQIVEAFEPGDTRLAFSILQPGQVKKLTSQDGKDVSFTMKASDTPTGYAYQKWWWGPSEENDHSKQNKPVLRLPEVLLNYAEALNELGQPALALEQVNKVRVRAKIPPLAGVTDKTAMMDAIMKERRLETTWEYNWWFHLTRTGRAADFVKKEYGREMAPFKYLFPLPQIELDVNKALKQNDGY